MNTSATTTANWSFPTPIRFGPGRVAELADACAAAGMTRPLLVTDRALAALPITAQALQALEAGGFARAVFDGVDANPDEANLAAGVEAFREGGHDGVVAFGGGSAMDLGKLIAFMAGQTRPVWDFEDVDDWWTRADPSSIAPVVALPTTAGTGSEVGRAAVLTNAETAEKKIIFHPDMLPKVVIADPKLTVGMPRMVTAGTGMDAFAHCLEAYCSPHFHPMAQGIALEGMALVRENLPRAYAAPDDLKARGAMMAAAIMGATSFQKGLGAIHALSHPIGAIYGVHHGATNAVVMSAVLRFNRPAIEERIQRAAAYLEIEGGFDGFVGLVKGLRTGLGIPADLTSFGVPRGREEEIVEKALRDPSCGGNPVAMTAKNTRALLSDCFG